ncbi:oxidoreductase [Paenibacillus sambharensis]|uniref:Oxidoreductase n=1 Tax=Paenibacillus sambharensis TaxID=1803190 RepID=A0A2W1L271_9BACL|nr:PhzF family phenazine biosynthesis protein [Paenibacillus sambharensis]PZD92989.1 oxidoreductase [Paenibacillus sambharensis]
MTLPIYVVDAFTAQPFKGNPAGVCLTAEPLTDEFMQDIAAEMNLSETAFLYPEQDGFSLRWFTPTAEVKLCGHATLASAHMLWERQVLGAGQRANFYTKSGLLTAVQKKDWIELNFPAEPVSKTEYPAELLEALKLKDPVFVGRNRFDYLIEVHSEEEVRGLNPDFSLLHTIPTRGVLVTSRADHYDFISRCFFPAVGVNEDPVTGSAYCALAPYWSERLGRTGMHAYQASARGGELKLELQQDRVLMAGQAVTVMKNELLVEN